MKSLKSFVKLVVTLFSFLFLFFRCSNEEKFNVEQGINNEKEYLFSNSTYRILTPEELPDVYRAFLEATNSLKFLNAFVSPEIYELNGFASTQNYTAQLFLEEKNENVFYNIALKRFSDNSLSVPTIIKYTSDKPKEQINSFANVVNNKWQIERRTAKNYNISNSKSINNNCKEGEVFIPSGGDFNYIKYLSGDDIKDLFFKKDLGNFKLNQKTYSGWVEVCFESIKKVKRKCNGPNRDEDHPPRTEDSVAGDGSCGDISTGYKGTSTKAVVEVSCVNIYATINQENFEPGRLLDADNLEITKLTISAFNDYTPCKLQRIRDELKRDEQNLGPVGLKLLEDLIRRLGENNDEFCKGGFNGEITIQKKQKSSNKTVFGCPEPYDVNVIIPKASDDLYILLNYADLSGDTLSEDEIKWIFNYKNIDKVENILDFIKSSGFSAASKTEAKMRLRAEMVNDTDSSTPQWDFSQKGKLYNREVLKYKAVHNVPNTNGTERMYLLENGLVLYQANGEKKINDSDFALPSTESKQDGYNYIYSYDTQKYYEYRIPKLKPQSADLDFLFNAFWKHGVANAVRYATPLEDWIILINGKDLNHEAQSKVQTAGFMIVGFIPGGKVLKPLNKGAGKLWKIIIKNGDKVFTRTIKELSQETIQHFDKYVEGAGNLLQEALRKGEILDHEIVIDLGQEIADLSAKKGGKLSWPELKALLKRGNDFNTKAVKNKWYTFNEVHLGNGKRVDSFDPVKKEIISRKATDLKNIKFSTFEKYLKEMKSKYWSGVELKSTKYKDDFEELGITKLEGKQILEIPDSNLSFNKINEYIEFAKNKYDITIRFKPE